MTGSKDQVSGPATASVYGVAVRLPKTLGPKASVADARRAFDDDHVHMLLITDAGRLLGTLVREDLAPSADGSARALDHAVLLGRTLPPETSAEQALGLLLSAGERRRAVVAEDGQLLGLLCLKRKLTGFCSDADVASRAAAAGS